jgi:hypothetical protein|tara:strand:- start:699 stop:806 length:108 start_codon:yes stop_codon:yes gene_type:complete
MSPLKTDLSSLIFKIGGLAESEKNSPEVVSEKENT